MNALVVEQKYNRERPPIESAPCDPYRLFLLLLLLNVRLLAEVQPGKDSRVLLPYSLQALGIESKGLQDGRSNLSGLDRTCDGLGREPGVRHEHHHVGVVVREAAMLHQLSDASRVDHSNIGRHEDIRRARVSVGGQTRSIEQQGQGWPRVYLTNSGTRRVRFQHGDRVLCLARIGKPQERDVVLGGPDLV